MTLAISTSSPVTSVALFSCNDLIGHEAEEANRNASELVIRITDYLLSANKSALKDIQEIVVDHGPGSFTGVKVGVTIAKMWADAIGAKLYAIDSFDLISTDSTVFVPHKRDSLVVRRLGFSGAPGLIEQEEDAIGYGIAEYPEVLPDAAKAYYARDRWFETTPLELKPNYVVEPSISQPKTPFPSANP